MLSPSLTAPSASGVLYLHGFNSGSASPKAELVRAACAALGIVCESPQLPHRPAAALALAEARLAGLGPRPLVVGSSMGGFLATCLAERHGLRAALINPAVAPAQLVTDWVGMAFANPYTDESFSVTDTHIDELTALTPERVSAWRYLVLLGTADETLDPGEAFRCYRESRTILHPGGNHGFDALAAYLPAIFAHGGHFLAPGRITQLDIDDA